MFTGLVESLGHITHIEPLDDGITATIQSSLDGLTEGESIAVDGVCSTALAISGSQFSVNYLEETLQKTTFTTLHVGQSVNLERALLPTTRLGGHFVSGHVDSTGTISTLDVGDTWGVIRLTFDPTFRPYLIPKGSICIDGISLTIVDLEADSFSCHLIPHTLENTSLKSKSAGSQVNLEFDLLGKYLYNFYTLNK